MSLGLGKLVLSLMIVDLIFQQEHKATRISYQIYNHNQLDALFADCFSQAYIVVICMSSLGLKHSGPGDSCMYSSMALNK